MSDKKPVLYPYREPEPPPKDPIAELEAMVERMRALGVTEFNGIKLGPAPTPPSERAERVTPEERKAAAEERRRDVLFAASRIKPVIRGSE